MNDAYFYIHLLSFSLCVRMSKNVLNNNSFLKLILNTSKEQGLALLHSVTPEQVLFLSEIALNILQLPLPKKATALVNKKKKIYQRLANKKFSKTRKKDIIKKNSHQLLLLLLSIKQQLLSLE